MNNLPNVEIILQTVSFAHQVDDLQAWALDGNLSTACAEIGIPFNFNETRQLTVMRILAANQLRIMRGEYD